MLCDASLIPVAEHSGAPTSVGRRTRTIPAALRRALRARDGGCRFPGCSHDRFVDAHHIHHWAAGGETSVENLVHLCRRHHRLIHEDGFSVERDDADGRLIFHDPGGVELRARPGPLRGDPDAVCAEARRTPRLATGQRLDLELTVGCMLSRRSEPAAAAALS